MTYRPELDGLRAVAVLLVVLVHCNVPGMGAAQVGVDLFFVLSGYLITSLLLAEHARGGIRIGAFYWRRALRLYPALLLFLGVYLAVAPLAWPDHDHVSEALVAGLYLTDYWRVWFDWPLYLSHTWSLAVEEHFYLLWPPILVWLLRRYSVAQIAKGLAVAAIVAVAWRTIADGGMHRMDMRVTGLLAGCALAAWQRTGATIPVSAEAAVVTGSLLLAFALATPGPTHLPFNVLFADAATVCFLYGASALPLTHPRLVALGQLSYGVYLWHFPISRWMIVGYDPWLSFSLTLVVSFILAWVSFHTVEAFARRYRHRVTGTPSVPLPLRS